MNDLRTKPSREENYFPLYPSVEPDDPPKFRELYRSLLQLIDETRSLYDQISKSATFKPLARNARRLVTNVNKHDILLCQHFQTVDAEIDAEVEALLEMENRASAELRMLKLEQKQKQRQRGRK